MMVRRSPAAARPRSTVAAAFLVLLIVAACSGETPSAPDCVASAVVTAATAAGTAQFGSSESCAGGAKRERHTPSRQ